MLPAASTCIIKCKCSVEIVLPVLIVVQALAYPATTIAVSSTYVNDVEIINFHVIPRIISHDECVGTFGSGILGNIVVLYDNGEWRCKYISLLTYN